MKICAFTGHRPGRFNFRNEQDDLCVRIKASIAAVLRQLYIERGVRNVFTGGALGADMWAAEEALLLKEEYPDLEHTCVLPFDGHTQRWPNAETQRLDTILAKSNCVPPLFKAYTPEAYRIRNQWMIDRADFLIAVYDGIALASSGTGQTVRMALEKEIPIVFIDPDKAEIFRMKWEV